MNALFENRRNLLAAAAASGILYVASQFVITKLLEPIGGAEIIRFQLTFDAENLAAILGTWGPAGIETFRSHFYLDFIHPFLYGAFLFFTLLYIRAGLSGPIPSGGIPMYCYIPFIATAFDCTENALELAILAQYPDLSGALVFTAALFSLIKWLVAALSIVMIIVTGARLALKTIAGKRAAA